MGQVPKNTARDQKRSGFFGGMSSAVGPHAIANVERECKAPAESIGGIANPLLDLRFRALLPGKDWSNLPAEVRARFSKRLAGGRTAVYAGRMAVLNISRAGRMLAQALRLIGAPLPLTRDVDVPSVVTVTEDVATGGQIWTRMYARRDGFPQVIHSSKRFSGPTGLEEYIGLGVSIPLKVSVEDHTLVFRSAGYFCGAGKFRLPLPRWLAPGALEVRHRAIDSEDFEFSMTLRHRLFGTLIEQSGIYREVRE